MFDEVLAKIFDQVNGMSAAELTNLEAIVSGKMRQHAGRPVGNVPAPITPAVAEVTSRLDTLSTSNLALLNTTITKKLESLVTPPGQG